MHAKPLIHQVPNCKFKCLISNKYVIKNSALFGKYNKGTNKLKSSVCNRNHVCLLQVKVKDDVFERKTKHGMKCDLVQERY